MRIFEQELTIDLGTANTVIFQNGQKVNIPFHVAEDPLRAVAQGTCEALKNVKGYKFLMR